MSCPTVSNTPVALNTLPRPARIFIKLLAGIKTGHLTLHMPDGKHIAFGDTQDPLHANLHLNDWGVCQDILTSSDIGLGESYIAGRWFSNDIPALISIAIYNRNSLARVMRGNLLSLLIYQIKHKLRANTKTGSRKNILAHYDVGNDFYRLWLDRSMTYSSALFAGDRKLSLIDAQQAKYQRILTQLDCKPFQSVLEIGCGWGGFAEIAANNHIVVHGVTLSPSQLAYAQSRTAHYHEAVRPKLSLTDYRDIHGQFDHIVSIEMFEAVGERYWSDYFKAIKRLLRPQGSAVVQTITIADTLFSRYRRSTDFIQQYVFPGGMLPSLSVFKTKAAQAGLKVIDAYSFGLDYAETLKRWRIEFHQTWEQAQRQGFDQRFYRLWDFYLAYCEAGFTAGATSVYQIKLIHAEK
ncbi:MAG: class I SAM-dependent methyltransferase [Sulfuriferula sp.]|nr:class I SAM-dependent methyltransferase [Sulfuriferula sp.]